MKAFLILHILFIFSVFSLQAATIYVSSSQGDDANDGMSEQTPIQSLQKINNMIFGPGDRIYFKSGDNWKGMFWPKGSGSEGSPIRIDMYGGDIRPVIDGDGYQCSILLYNSDYFEIRNLVLTNENSYLDNNNNPKKLSGFEGEINNFGTGRNVRYGIKIVGSSRSLAYFRLENIEFHDIYPSPTNNSYKHQGYGVKFETQSNANSNSFYHIKDVIIEKCLFTRLGHYGIHIKPLGVWKIEDHEHEDYIIRENTFLHTGGSGIVPNYTNGLLIENCVFDHTGSDLDDRMWKRGSGLWPFYCKNVIIQNNQFMNARGPGDSYGAHIDYGNENIVLQYNFSYNNEGGFAEILGDNINCGYRYNISVNDGWRVDPNGNDWALKGKIFWISDFCGSNQGGCLNSGNFIYNNTIFVPSHLNPEIFVKNKTGDSYIYNNLIYVNYDGLKIKTLLQNNSNQFSIANNLFFPQNAFEFDDDLTKSAYYLNPLLVNPGSQSQEDYKLRKNSPAIKKGFLINGSEDPLNYLENNGGRDFFGSPVSQNLPPNIGAYNGEGVLVGVQPFMGDQNEEYIYPNPATQQISIPGIKKGFFKISDSFGNIVQEGVINDSNIDVSQLNKAFYILYCQNKNESFTKRFLKI